MWVETKVKGHGLRGTNIKSRMAVLVRGRGMAKAFAPLNDACLRSVRCELLLLILVLCMSISKSAPCLAARTAAAVCTGDKINSYLPAVCYES